MGLFSGKKKEVTIEDLQKQLFDNPDLSQEFYTRLFSNDVFIGGETDAKIEGDQVLEGGAKIRFVSLAGPDNELFIPVFTSMEEMQKVAPEGAPCLALNGHAVFTMTLGSVIVLNPGNDYALRLEPDYIKQVLDFFAANNA